MKGASEVTKRVISQNNVVDYRQLLFTYIVTDASFAFNSKFKRKYLNNKSLDSFVNIKMHDSFFALLLASEKHLFYINEPLVLYRRHGGDMIGFNSNKNTKILEYITKRKSIIGNRKKIIQDARIMITKFNINKDVQIELDTFITTMESNKFFRQWKLISKYEAYLMVKPKILEKIAYSFFIKL